MKDNKAVEKAVEILRYQREHRFAPNNKSRLNTILLLALNGVEPAHHALCDYADLLTAEQNPLPYGLQLYLVFAASGGFKAKKKRFKSFERDLAITVAVRELVACGYDPTRNETTKEIGKRASGSLVAEGLAQLGENMTEAAVEQIWKRKGKALLTKPPTS